MNILWLMYVHMLDKPLGVEFLHQRMCAFKILIRVAKLASKTATSVSGRDRERYCVPCPGWRGRKLSDGCFILCISY